MKFLIVAFSVVIAAFILRFLKLIINKVGDSNRMVKKIQVAEPLIALVAWVLLLFWVIYFLFYEKSYYNFIVFALIVLIFLSVSWFFVKDFIAGVAFKVQNNYSSGDIVQFGNVSGKLDTLHLTHVSIYTNEGRLVKIPYSRLSNEIVSQKSAGGSLGREQFVLKVRKKQGVDELKEKLNNLLLNSPWRVSSRMPSVKLKAESEDFFEFEIQLEARNEKHLNYVVSFLSKKFD